MGKKINTNIFNIILISLLCSCSNKNYNLINDKEIRVFSYRIKIIDESIIKEIKETIYQYNNDCNFAPDYCYLYKIDDTILIQLSKYQITDSFKEYEIKNSIESCDGICLIDDVPIIVDFYNNIDKSFIVQKDKIMINFKSTEKGCILNKSYKYKEGRLILYDEIFMKDIKVEKAKW